FAPNGPCPSAPNGPIGVRLIGRVNSQVGLVGTEPLRVAESAPNRPWRRYSALTPGRTPPIQQVTCGRDRWGPRFSAAYAPDRPCRSSPLRLIGRGSNRARR